MSGKLERKGKVRPSAKPNRKSKGIPSAGAKRSTGTPPPPTAKKECRAENAPREKSQFSGAAQSSGISTLGSDNVGNNSCTLPKIEPTLKSALAALGGTLKIPREGSQANRNAVLADGAKYLGPSLEADGFRYSSLADLWDVLAFKRHEKRARTNQFAYYEMTKRLPCFDAAKSAWLTAYRRHCWGKRHKELADPALTKNCLAEIVLFAVGDYPRPVDALQQFADCIHTQAKAGEIGFFTRLAKALQYAEKKAPPGSLALNILNHWLCGLLWLMTYDDAINALRLYVRNDVDPRNFARVCRRLQLERCTDLGLPVLVKCYVPKLPEKFKLTKEGEKLLRATE